MSNKLYYVWLSLNTHVYDKGVRRLFEDIRNPEAIYRMNENDLNAQGYLEKATVHKLMNKDLKRAENIVEGCEKSGYDIFSIDDAYYPASVLNICDYPYVLYHRGLNFDYENQLCISVVGTRKCTGAGAETAKNLSRDLALNGVVVVSGMAGGIDSAAHRGAVSVNKPTVAVLGTGIDLVTPVSNGDIYDYMVTQGAVYSEFAPGTQGFPQNFPQRNRIISALGHGLLVVEAPASSGALITANMAVEQNKDVFAIPGDIKNKTAYGSNRLIQRGAKLVMDVHDILEEYPTFQNNKTEIYNPEETVQNFKKEDFISSLKNLTPMEKVIVEMMEAEPLGIDYISEKTNIPVSKILSAMTMLEIKKVVQSLPGKRYRLNMEE